MEFQEFNNYPSLNLLIVKLQTLQLPIEGNDNRFVADMVLNPEYYKSTNEILWSNYKLTPV